MADCTLIGSWTELKTEIDGGFSGTITLAANFNCDYNSEIDIDPSGRRTALIEIGNGQDVTISANGAVCNAQQGGQFFRVAGTLTLNGMTLKNGSSAEYVSVFTLLWLAICNTSATHTPSCNNPSPQPPCAMLLQTLLQHHVKNSTATREGPSSSTTVQEHSTSMAAPSRATLQPM
jgi:hypothetical protein